ncbi:hypothetical protein PIB30_065380 [Stylosanthes scabra]|uniref:Putative plant transposon protein domain-containing protein n=1 Tax=Stylosanthes scabra TaxID=79078 RepID=A0ABU6RMV5_9FABA|nr:hypothetical protein [Stylosanthes scabra]
MSSSSTARYDAHRFRSAYHQRQFEKHVTKKTVTPETNFELQEDQYPEIQEQIAKRGWKRLTNPRTKISNLLIQEFYANAVRTKEEIASGEAYPYQSYVRVIRETLRIPGNTPGAKTDFNTRQREDQKLDEVIREICVPGARWKMSSSQPDQPIQLKRRDLTPLARGCHEFIIHSIIPTGNNSNNVAIIAEGVQGRGKLIFPSTIYRLCKEAEVPLREFRGGELILVNKPITTRVMNNFYNRMRTEQEKTIKKIEEIKKFQVNQTLMGFRKDPIDKLEMRMDNQHKEIVEMRAQIKEWTKNASSREAYCCWAHQQANPSLVEIPTHKVPEFVHDNAAKGKHIFQGALKSHNQGEPSQPADQPMEEPEKE